MNMFMILSLYQLAARDRRLFFRFAIKNPRIIEYLTII
jgi:hypothetical protein